MSGLPTFSGALPRSVSGALPPAVSGALPPAASSPLPDSLIELVAQRFRVLGEPMRIKLLDRLREGDTTVSELQDALGASQQNVSKHLGILHSANMVSRTKRGNTVVYAISDPTVFELCDRVCGGMRRQVQELEAILRPGEPPAGHAELLSGHRFTSTGADPGEEKSR